MKIIIVLPYLKSIGGAARYAWEFAEYLSSKGDDVIIASLYTDKKLYATKTKIKIVDLADESSLTQTIQFWLNLRKTTKLLTKLIMKEKPDIVFFNHYPCTMWVEKYDHIPIICYPQDINLLYTNTYINNLPTTTRLLWRILRLFIRYYDRKKWRLFDQVICNSNFIAQYVKKHYKISPNVIHLGTNTTVFTKLKDHKKQNVILTLGDTKIRRADLLIKAAAKILKKRNDLQIWVAGSKNKLDKELKSLSKDLGIEKHVIFFGKISDVQLTRLYSESLATVHLVKEAPFGLIVIESMSCGTPVISWKPGGPEETIIDGKTGFLIPENNEKMLIEKIELFLDNPNLSSTMGIEAMIRVKTFFDLANHHEIMRNNLLKWIESIKHN